MLRQDSKTQAASWPGKLFDPDALKAYMPEESGEKKGVYEDQVATFKADILDELAKKLGITDAAAFKKSVERYNALAAEGKDEDFGKDGKWLTTIDTPSVLWHSPQGSRVGHRLRRACRRAHGSA